MTTEPDDIDAVCDSCGNKVTEDGHCFEEDLTMGCGCEEPKCLVCHPWLGRQDMSELGKELFETAQRITRIYAAANGIQQEAHYESK